MTTITEIIARLGHACRIPWAMCGSACMGEGIDGEVECCKVIGHEGRHSVTPDGMAVTWGPDRDAIPRKPLAEWQAEWSREHPGEPGPVASWMSEGGRVSWSANEFCVGVRVGITRATRRNGDRIWECGGEGTSADWAECVRLMQAADGGGG